MPWFSLLAIVTLAVPVWCFGWVPGHYCLRALGLSWLATVAFLAATQPDLLRRRSKEPTEGPVSPGWDGRLLRLLQGSLWLLLLVAGWESGWGGTALDPELFAAGSGFLLLGTLLLWSSLHSNPYFETRVRHQREQGQQVVQSGLYAWIRHPGYLALIVMLASLPLMLHSPAAVLPAVFCVVILVVRLRQEEGYLDAHLAGYAEYRAKVPFRLLPLVW